MMYDVPDWAYDELWPCPDDGCRGFIGTDRKERKWWCGDDCVYVDQDAANELVARRVASREKRAAAAARFAARREADDTRTTCVYYLYAADGALLYVGITSQDPPWLRWREHQKAWWWPLVVRQRVDWYGSRNTAKAKESAVIKSDAPVMNKHERTPDQLDAIRPTVLRYWVDLGRDAADLPPSRYWEVA